MAVEGAYTAQPIVEVAWGAGPYDDVADDEWSDLSDAAFEVTITRGRSSEFDQFPPSTASVGLRNDDRRFDPLNTASPHDGLLVPNVPLRILGRAPDAARLYFDDMLATGVEPWWEVSWGAIDPSGGVGGVMTDELGLFIMYGHVNVPHRGLHFTVEATNITANLIARLELVGGTGWLGFSAVVGGTLTYWGEGVSQGSMTYNATTCRYLRVVVESSTDTVWLTSPDGVTWTERNREVGLSHPSIWHQVRIGMDGVGATGRLQQVELGTDTLPLFRGLVDAWPSRYAEGGAFSDTTVAATDAFKVLAERPMPDATREFLEDTTAIGEPESWYRCDALEGNRVVDAMGVRDGYVSTSLSTTEPLCHSSTGALEVPAFQTETGWKRQAVVFPIGAATDLALRGTSWSLAFMFRASDRGALGAGAHRIMSVEIGPDFSSTAVQFLALNLWADTQGGRVTCAIDGVGATITLPQPASSLSALGSAIDVYDGQPHHLVVVRSGTTGHLYIDGQLVVSATAGAATGWYDMTGGAFYVGRTTFGSGTPVNPAWVVDELMLWPDDMSAVDVALLFDHLKNGWQAPATSGEVIGSVLDLISWPDELRALDEGEVSMWPPGDVTGSRALDLLQTLAATEQGRLFVNPMGQVTFHDRGRFLIAPVERDVQYTFTDQDRDVGWADAGTVDGSLVLSLDDRHAYDAAMVTREGGEPQRSSLVATPSRTITVGGLMFATDLQAAHLAEWLTFRYGEAQPRTESWQVDPEVLPEDWGQLLALDIGHRIAHQLQPGGVGSAIDLEQHVEVVGHEIGVESWVITLNGTPVDPNDYLIWADVDMPSTSDPNGWADTDGTPPGGAWG